VEGTLAFRDRVDEFLPHLFLQASARRLLLKLETRKLSCFQNNQNIAKTIPNDCHVRISMFLTVN
jgi:hypothetical protein